MDLNEEYVMIYNTIQGLIRHGIRSGLITEEDELVVRNQLMDLLHLTEHAGLHQQSLYG